MKFCTTLLAVTDMERSLRFYRELFGQEVAVDLGWNKTLTCGLTLQEHFEEIAEFAADTMRFRPNTMELYFETENFDEFLALLEKHPEVERLHEPKTFPWLQRGIRIFDPNGHLIEISESMYSVARGLFAEGKSVEDAAKLTQHPLEVVTEWHKAYLKSMTSVCGTDCGTCSCYKTMCEGCNTSEGKVFHSPQGCKIYGCVTGDKKLPHCGACDELPCSIWTSTRDPKFSDQEFEQNISMRVQTLRGL